MEHELMSFNLPKDQSSIIKVIGVGGGGGNAVEHMFEEGITDVDFLICNTDAQAIRNSPIPIKIQLGETLTQGLGAGNTPTKGKEAAIESLAAIEDALANNTKMVFITAGMGGGTGTGAAPVIAEAAKDMGILTVGIVTLPFRFEGNRRMKQAVEGLKEIREHVDTLLVISNEKIREIHGDLSLTDAFRRADNVLTVAAKGIAEIITVHGSINVDFADVKTVMENSGVALMGSATAEGENRAIDAIQEALTSPLLNNNDINGAKNILLNISSGTKSPVKMDEITEITEYLQQVSGTNADVIWGHNIDDSLEDKLNITIIATGFKDDSVPELAAMQGNSEKISVSLNLEKSKDEQMYFQESSSKTDKEVVEFEISESDMQEEQKQMNRPEKKESVDSRTAMSAEQASAYYDNDFLLEREIQPAYKRRGVKIDDMPEMIFNNDEMAKCTLSTEDGKTRIKKENSFLSNNVD